MSTIPFSIPSEYAAALMDGSLIRIGTLLKESATGKIVAHVQETGAVQNVLGNPGNMFFTPFDILTSSSSLYANIQLDQLKTMIESLQILQYANLGVSLAGIGINVLGFAMINRRLDSISNQISSLSEKIDQQFQELHERELRDRFYRIRSLYEQADLAHAFKDPVSRWLYLESRLVEESGFFKGEIDNYLQGEIVKKDLLKFYINAWSLCNAGRVECLLSANELEAAHKSAKQIGQEYSTVFDGISPFHLTQKILSEKPEQIIYSQFRAQQTETVNLIQSIRDMTDAALTKPLLIETLIANGIDGNQYLSAIRQEKEEPILLLKTTR